MAVPPEAACGYETGDLVPQVQQSHVAYESQQGAAALSQRLQINDNYHLDMSTLITEQDQGQGPELWWPQGPIDSPGIMALWGPRLDFATKQAITAARMTAQVQICVLTLLLLKASLSELASLWLPHASVLNLVMDCYGQARHMPLALRRVNQK